MNLCHRICSDCQVCRYRLRNCEHWKRILSNHRRGHDKHILGRFRCLHQNKNNRDELSLCCPCGGRCCDHCRIHIASFHYSHPKHICSDEISGSFLDCDAHDDAQLLVEGVICCGQCSDGNDSLPAVPHLFLPAFGCLWLSNRYDQ